MRRILFEIPFPLELPIIGRYLTIPAFGVMAALGFLAAFWIALDRGRREGIKEEVIWDVWFRAFIGGLVGARLLFVLQNPDVLEGRLWEAFAIWHGGLVWYGGVAGALILGIAYLLRRRQPMLRVCDAMSPAGMVGLAIGRVGCFLNGCCFGQRTDSFLGVTYPKFGGAEHFHSPLAEQFSPAFAFHVQEHGLSESSLSSFPVHPTQLYASATALLIFLLLTLYYPRRKREGEVFYLMFLLYGTGRFLIEGLRTNDVVWMNLSLAQVMSLMMVPVALGLFLRSRLRPAPATATEKPRARRKGKPARTRRR